MSQIQLGVLIAGIDIPADAITKRPSIPLSVLTNESALQAFINIYDWVINEIKSNYEALTTMFKMYYLTI